MGRKKALKIIVPRLWSVIALCLIMVVNACVTNIPTNPVPSKTISFTNTPSFTPTTKSSLTLESPPTPKNLFQGEIHLEPSNNPLPSYITFNPENLPSTSGTYLLYTIDNELKYTSLDRKLQGTILSFNPPYEYQENGNGMWNEIHYYVTDDSLDPKVVLTTFRDGDLSVWSTDLSGKLLNYRSAQISPNSDTSCAAPQLSPQGRWMAGYCRTGEMSYPYFVDLEQSKGKYLVDTVCEDPRNEGWGGFDWSANEKVVSTYCEATQYLKETYDCYILTDDYRAVCKNTDRLAYYLDLSPDGNRVVKVDSVSDSEKEKPTNTSRIVVESLECLIAGTGCEDQKTFELPLYKWFTSHEIQPGARVEWSPSGTQLAWSLTPSITINGAMDFGPTTTGVIDLQKETKEPASILIRGALDGFSPDGKWLLYVKDNTLTLISTENYSKQLVLVDASSNRESTFDDSKGWLVIP